VNPQVNKNGKRTFKAKMRESRRLKEWIEKIGLKNYAES